NVAVGNARLRIYHDEYAAATRDIVVAATGYADRAFEIPDIDLADATTVRGRVVDRNGRAVPTARVSTAKLAEVRPKVALEEAVVLTVDSRSFVPREFGR